ncbi:MAG TPA: S8 family peptidase [Candidatus Obscuribacterales bacterium]
MRKPLVLGLIAGILAGCQTNFRMSPVGTMSRRPMTRLQSAAARPQIDHSQVLVHFKSPLSPAGLQAYAGQHGLQLLRHSQGGTVAVFRASSQSKPLSQSGGRLSAMAATELPRRAAQDPNVEHTQPLIIYHAYGVDARFGEQHALPRMQVPAAWRRTMGATAVTVAVLDTGVDLNHPDLRPNLLPGNDFVNELVPDVHAKPAEPEEEGEAEPELPPLPVPPGAGGIRAAGAPVPGTAAPIMDFDGHGTHVAGLVAAVANNGIGIAGVAPNCKILPVKVLDSTGSGDSLSIASGIRWATDHGAQVMNLSLGTEEQDPEIKAAVAYALSKNRVIIAAAGNESTDKPSYPAAYPGVIAVAALDREDQLADFSNYGPWISVSAPGTEILSTTPGYDVLDPAQHDYDFKDGTSMASPLVAGVAALILSQNPGMPGQAVKQRLEQSADDIGAPGFDPRFGHGRVNALRALGPLP